MDEIRIENLEVYAYHGVYPEEKKNGQPFFINVTLYLDLRRAGKSDDLNESVNYGEVCHKLDEWMKERSYDLLEKAAEEMSERLLLHFSLVKAVDFEIRKPEAPIGLPFESVSVKIHRGWEMVYLAVGSNMGQKENYIQNAKRELEQNPYFRKVRMSSLITTKPYGGVEQDDFLNGAIEAETLYQKKELLAELHRIEQLADRKREIHWGPRTLDLDILFFGKEVYEDEELIIPHVDLHNRTFVLEPMCELAPNFRHPVLNRTVRELLEELLK